MNYWLIAFFSTLFLGHNIAFSQTIDDKPWELKDTILIIDPYEGNTIDWARLSNDRKVKALIHRAYHGTRADNKYEARIKEAKKIGLLTGVYLLGKPGNPITQANLLIEAGKKSNSNMIALDIENMNHHDSMSINDAEKFLNHVYSVTGRYPVFYTNFSTYNYISNTYGKDSAFAKAPLWIARFARRHGMNNSSVWDKYSIWQFQSEINCVDGQKCFRRVLGTASDMDVNVFRGSELELKALFGG